MPSTKMEKTGLRISTSKSLPVVEAETPRVLTSPTLPKQSALVATSSAHGRLTIRVLESSDFGLPSFEAPSEPAANTTGIMKSIRRASLGMKRPVEARVASTACVCIVLQIGVDPVLEFTTSSLLSAQDTWHEDFAVESASSDDVLMLYGVNRLKSAPHKSIAVDVWDDHPACFGKVCIPLSRLPEHEEIEQWYSFSGSRAAVRVALKFSPALSSLPAMHSPANDRQRAKSSAAEPEESPPIIESPQPTQEHVLPTGIVDYVLFVGPDANDEHVVLSRSPKDDRKDFPLPTKIEWFCFPGGYEVVRSKTKPPANVFSFALIGGQDGLSRCYGVCVIVHHIKMGVPTTSSGARQWEPTCICFLSRLPLLPSLQTSLLQLVSVYLNPDPTIARVGGHVVDQLTRRLPLPVAELLDVAVAIVPGAPVAFSLRHTDMHGLKYALPPALYSLETFFRAFSLHTAIRLVVLALCEYRIVVHSSHLSLLCPITESLKALLYPFRWQHPYVPMLPRILSEYLQAPLPYILGVQTSWLPGLFESGRPDNLVLVDVDRGTLNISHEASLPPLPATLTKALYRRLKPMLAAPLWNASLEHRVRLSFACYLTSMIQGYRDCLFFVDSSFPVFNKRRFLTTTVSPERTPFVTRLLSTQAFESFLENHSGSRLHAFHAIYLTLSQTDETTWLDEPASTPTPVHETPLLHVSLYPARDNETWTTRDVTRSIQASDLSILEQLKLKPALGTPRSSSGVWTYEKIADTLHIDRSLFESNWEKIMDPFSHFAPPSHAPTPTRELSSEEEQVQESIHKCLVSVFSSELLSDDECRACQRSFKAPYARELFVLILMQPHHRSEQASGVYNPRGSGSCLGDAGFKLLVTLATQVLQDCEIHEDYTNARGLLQVSAQFYRLVDDRVRSTPRAPGFGALREYLQQSLKTQPICRSLDMWHHALSRDIEAALKSETIEPHNDAPSDISDDMFFSQMGSLVYDMLNLDNALGKVQLFVAGMCSTYNRGKEVQDTLSQLVENLHRAIVLSSDNVVSSTAHASWALAPSSTDANYELDSVIRRRISTTTLASSSKSSLPPESTDENENDPNAILLQTQSPVLCLSVHRDRIAAGCLDATIAVHSAATTTRLQGHVGALSTVQVRGDMVISGALDGTVRVWDLHTTSPSSSLLTRKPSLFRFLSPTTDALIATPSPFDEYRPRTLKGHTMPIAALDVGKQLGNSRWCLASGALDKTIRIWDSSKDASSAPLSHSAPIACLKFLTGSTTLVSGDARGDVDVWDAAAGRKKAHFAAHRGGLTDLQLAGDRLVSAANDRTLKVWDVRFRSGQSCTHVLLGHSAPVTCIALGGPADPTICSGSADGTVKVWDLRATGRGARLELSGHSGRVTVLQRDFTKVISGSEDGSLRVWNTHTGACTQVLEGHASGITGLGVRDSVGPNLVSSSWDGTVRIWNVSMES